MILLKKLKYFIHKQTKTGRVHPFRFFLNLKFYLINKEYMLNRQINKQSHVTNNNRICLVC